MQEVLALHTHIDELRWEFQRSFAEYVKTGEEMRDALLRLETSLQDEARRDIRTLQESLNQALTKYERARRAYVDAVLENLMKDARVADESVPVTP